MPRFGLALSGGGFRAVLYHLGVVRFLRDGGLLPQITHITSVSGGSVLGAHLALNWDRYCGSDDEFQQVTDEIIRLLQLDVRNRIVRRFPLASLANMCRRTLRMRSLRKFTRAGLLEQHYKKFLYGDTSLFSLPEQPRLYILATNLSEGSLCAFHRDGLLVQRRTPGRLSRIEEVSIGLATVPMAVAASSAFPGFFPPLELKNWEVGAMEGDFSRLSFTDGGIYDNIGLRMFHHLQQTSQREESVPEMEDVLDAEALTSALLSGAGLPENTPMRQLWERLSASDLNISDALSIPVQEQSMRIIVEGLGTIIRNDALYRDPVFQEVALLNPRAVGLLDAAKASHDRLDMNDDHVWLNRQLVRATLQQASGKECLRAGDDRLDGVLVSDAGATFKVRAEGGRAGGLMSTAMRSTDILMDRVNQLELESFYGAPGVIFFPIAKVVEPAQDPSAPHREIQHHAALIRTDMDAFSDLEVSALAQHGYCVARQACREKALLPEADIPTGPPWNPLAARTADNSGRNSATAALNDPKDALQTARSLQRSSSRRILSTLVSVRDWPTYVWVPLVTTLLLTLPYLLYKSNKTAVQRGYVLSAIAETSPLYRKILSLIDDGPIQAIEPIDYEETTSIEPLDFAGFEILSDNRIFDLRGWTAGTTSGRSAPYIHSRVRVRRTAGPNDNMHLRFQSETADEKLMLACRTESLKPRYKRMKRPDGGFLWELDLDFSGIPLGEDADVVLEGLVISEFAELYRDAGRFQFTIHADTGLAQIWMLMPTNRAYERFEISGWPIGEPDLSRTVVPTTTVELPIGSIATFQLINPRHDFRYECRWKWDVESE